MVNKQNVFSRISYMTEFDWIENYSVLCLLMEVYGKKLLLYIEHNGNTII